MFPAPPRPLANLELDFGSPVWKREAGPRAVEPLLVFGALKVFPAPPRPEWTYLPGCGCGSVIWYWDAILVVKCLCSGKEVLSRRVAAR